MIGLAFDEVDEEIGILGGQGEELVEERLLGLQLLAERPARVAVHEYVQESAGPARGGEHGNRRGAAPRSMLEIQSALPEIYRRVRRPALLLARVLAN
jgi:hypothetical protein